MGAFGWHVSRLPYECTNKLCRGRNHCDQCMRSLRIQNGINFGGPCRCTYCGKEHTDDLPENKILIEQIRHQAVVKYGIKYTCELITEESPKINDLQFDVDNRRRQLASLVNYLKRLAGWKEIHHTDLAIIKAETMVQELTRLNRRLQQSEPNNIGNLQIDYRRAISSVNAPENEIGWRYIDRCEELLVAIADAEFFSIFPSAYRLMSKWENIAGSRDEFEPKFFHLVKAIEDDFNHLKVRSVRVKIGLIGYTNTGKSCIINRLRKIADDQSDEYSPTRSKKCTYALLFFDSRSPLVCPKTGIETEVTFVDIRGHDNDVSLADSRLQTGNYLDEIRKADCDIYLLVFDEDSLRSEHADWISYIEKTLKRTCLLVRSKTDEKFLTLYTKYSNGQSYLDSSPEERAEFKEQTIDRLRRIIRSEIPHRVFFTAANYHSTNAAAVELLKNETFDMKELLRELGTLAVTIRSRRLYALTVRAIAQVVNTCFRRAYLINILNYQIGAGIGALFPFGDQAARYFARDRIRKAIGVDSTGEKSFRRYLEDKELIIKTSGGQCLQTSVFKDCVTKDTTGTNSAARGTMAIAAPAVAFTANFGDDFARLLAPTVQVITTGGRIISISLVATGVVISAAVCAWAAVDSKKHIFSYVNRLCDDLILISYPLIDHMLKEKNITYDESIESSNIR